MFPGEVGRAEQAEADNINPKNKVIIDGINDVICQCSSSSEERERERGQKLDKSPWRGGGRDTENKKPRRRGPSAALRESPGGLALSRVTACFMKMRPAIFPSATSDAPSSLPTHMYTREKVGKS